jgi:hypothetical protein
MPTEENPVGQNLLSHYGVSIAEYHGKGVLTLKDGKRVQCRFEAGQLKTGDVLLLLCNFLPLPPSCLSILANRFEGITSEGFRISAEGITATNYLPDLPIDCSGVWVALHLREMSVQMIEQDVKATKAHFGVTNFEFTGTEARRFDNFSYLILPLSLKCAGRATKLSVIPLKQYNGIMKRVKTLKSIDVTCEVVGDIPKDRGIAQLSEIVGDLCYLLSVARGTKIQWIYHDLYNGAGERIRRTHCSRVTKPFCPLPIIDPPPKAGGRHETKVFLEHAYPSYVEKRKIWRLNRGTIDAYLDAKAEHDYLEMRGVKLAVAMEMLKSVLLELPGSPVKEHIIAEQKFKNLRPAIRRAISNVLKDAGVDKKSRSAIYEKVLELNRRSFRDLLEYPCKLVCLEVKERDIKLFVACRNKLVHIGRFYCTVAKPGERKKCKPLPSCAHEYLFLVNFLDKVFLKLLGYSGPYIDWCEPNKPVRREQI